MRGHDVGVHHGVDREDSPPGRRQVLPLPVCMVRLPTSGPSGITGITGIATQRSGQ